MKQSTFDNINTLLEPKKLISIGILCLIAFLIIWFLWRKLKDSVTGVAKLVKDDVALEAYMSETGQRLSYTDKEYAAMAQQLYSAMYGAGTDEDAVISVFNRLNNDADCYKLINVFGLKKGKWSTTATDLYEWIMNDGMSDEVNDVLAAKKITVRF